MKAKIILKNVEFDYSHYFDEIRVKCPFCEFTSSRTRVYHSLKQLLFHLSDLHKNEGANYPFTLKEVKALMQTFALAKEWGLLC